MMWGRCWRLCKGEGCSGRVRHAPADGVPFSALEEELMAFGGEMEGAGSLDRADALVWAVTDLLIDAPEGDWGPRVRVL